MQSITNLIKLADRFEKKYSGAKDIIETIINLIPDEYDSEKDIVFSGKGNSIKRIKSLMVKLFDNPSLLNDNATKEMISFWIQKIEEKNNQLKNLYKRFTEEKKPTAKYYGGGSLLDFRSIMKINQTIIYRIKFLETLLKEMNALKDIVSEEKQLSPLEQKRVDNARRRAEIEKRKQEEAAELEEAQRMLALEKAKMFQQLESKQNRPKEQKEQTPPTLSRERLLELIEIEKAENEKLKQEGFPKRDPQETASDALKFWK